MTLSQIIKSIDALLGAHGFMRHGSTWVRERGEFTDLIDVQRGRSVDGITINIAVMHPPTYELAWGQSPKSAPTESDCIVRTRLGFLVDGKDRWWRPNDLSAVGEMAEDLAAVGLPFLATFKDLEDVERWLEASKANRYPPEALYLAAVKHQRGREAEALNIVEQLLKRTTSGPWRKRLVSMAALLT